MVFVFIFIIRRKPESPPPKFYGGIVSHPSPIVKRFSEIHFCAQLCKIMRNKDAKPHHRRIIKVKQNRGLAVIQKNKLAFEKQIGEKVPCDKYPHAVSRDKKPRGKTEKHSGFRGLFNARGFLRDQPCERSKTARRNRQSIVTATGSRHARTQHLADYKTILCQARHIKDSAE